MIKYEKQFDFGSYVFKYFNFHTDEVLEVKYLNFYKINIASICYF